MILIDYWLAWKVGRNWCKFHGNSEDREALLACQNVSRGGRITRWQMVSVQSFVISIWFTAALTVYSVSMVMYFVAAFLRDPGGLVALADAIAVVALCLSGLAFFALMQILLVVWRMTGARKYLPPRAPISSAEDLASGRAVPWVGDFWVLLMIAAIGVGATYYFVNFA